MPQMAPINWLSLFFMFFVIFIAFNMMNYYYILPSSSKSSSYKMSKHMFNWKW